MKTLRSLGLRKRAQVGAYLCTIFVSYLPTYYYNSHYNAIINYRNPVNLKHKRLKIYRWLNIRSADILHNIIWYKIPGLIQESRPKLNTFWKYAKVELSPPTPADIPQIRAGIGRLISGAKNGTWKNLTVKEAWLNTLVGVEVLCWFYVGECIGKRHIVGYDV